MDKSTGSTIRGRGEGALLVEINTKGKFNMYGDISVFEGAYNFRYGGLVQKDFSVVPGGTLAWNGKPMDAEIDIQAVYSTQTNPSPLLDNAINRKIPVNLLLQLDGTLDKLDIDYDFEFPNATSTVKSELNYRLESKDERSNQALYLLATGSFSSGLSELSINGTIQERLNGIINNLLGGNQDNKVQVGFDLELGDTNPDYETENRVGVTLQTNITDRIRINGKVGVPIGGVSQTAIAGDVQVDFLLNEDGTLTASFFNRENNIQNFGEEIGYTQGGRLNYSVDFDTFKELINKIFRTGPYKKEKKQETSETNTTSEESYVPSHTRFKTKEEKENQNDKEEN